MVHIIQAEPSGAPAHLVCSLCQQHWHSDDPELDLNGFIRTHLRAGNRYARLMGRTSVS